MADYNYTRSLVSGSYDQNNVLRVDGGSNQICMYKEIIAEGLLPNGFFMKSEGSSLTITFTNALTGSEKTLLDNLVSTHKSNG